MLCVTCILSWSQWGPLPQLYFILWEGALPHPDWSRAKCANQFLILREESAATVSETGDPSLPINRETSGFINK